MLDKEEVRVLIVDDDPLVSEMIMGKLSESRFKVAGKASNGQQGLEMIRKIKPDVVLMDIEMPKMDGLEATRLIFETCPTPVVMLTAYERNDLIEQAGKAGAGAYLVKPPSIAEIERAIMIAMARFDDMIQLRRLNEDLSMKNKELEAALENVKVLSGLIPICASCKKVRDDQGYWKQVEQYIEQHSEAVFSHSICEECADKLYGNQSWYQKTKAGKSGEDK